MAHSNISSTQYTAQDIQYLISKVQTHKTQQVQTELFGESLYPRIHNYIAI